MSRQPNPYKQVLAVLQELHTEYPTLSLGMHISTAFDGYGDLWAVSDKELFRALKEYKETLCVDSSCFKHEDIEKIVEDGKHLHNLITNEEDYGDQED